jgi:hypothetical protein
MTIWWWKLHSSTQSFTEVVPPSALRLGAMGETRCSEE